MNSTNAPMTPRTSRRHSFATPLKAHRDIQVLLNDDASEKQSRRKSLVEMRRKSSPFTTPTKASGSNQQVTTPKRNGVNSRQLEVVTPIPKIPVEQMSVNFEEWMKMATDNKINANNSWKLALIDYFHEMSLLKEGDSINFQKASCTLDGCVKIYTSRVDSVASETGKLLSGLADSSIKDDEAPENEEEERESEKRARKKTTRTEATLVKDYSVLMAKKLNLEFSVDPLFKKTSADFDEGGAQGLLLNRLSVDDDGKIIFDASDAIAGDNENKNMPSEGNDDSDLKIDITKLRFEFLSGLQGIFNKDLVCSSILDKFEFSTENMMTSMPEDRDGNDGDDIEEGINNQAPINGDTEENDFFEDNYETLGDGFAEDIIMEQEDLEGLGTRENIIETSQRRLSQREFVMAMTTNQNEMFSYFDSAFLRNWAGPEHWKMKQKPQNATNDESKKKKEKVSSVINFIESDEIDERSIFVKGGTTINLAKSAEYGSRNYLLPDDMQFNSKKMFRLFLKPEFTIELRGRSGSAEEQMEHGHIDDDQASFPDMTMVTHGETFFREDEYASEEAEGDYGNQLISQPKRTKPAFVKYAKTAKRVDVKKLKDNIWKTLTDSTDKTIATTSTSVAVPKPGDQVVHGGKKFTSIIENLKKIYPDRKMKDISVSFCFICLLHLANEKNLKIIGDENLSELRILSETGSSTVF
ncbi:10758_t:CDS:10 [Ambispora gerdemannii]|uniref:Condensin complex subunit 2 n=1 Tax=Ambispora gerdemannii TaxID=144530 RepID=A0A9N9FCS0_9GLOM|nr:10758_t:CDS:10 [Ambispora gerdemannii]